MRRLRWIWRWIWQMRQTPLRRGVVGVNIAARHPKRHWVGMVAVAALDGEEGAALDGEEGPPTLCVVPAFPTSHGGLVRARIANIEEVVLAYREEGGLSEAARASAIEPDAEDIGEAEGGSSAGIEKVVGAMPRPPEVCDEAFVTVVERAMNSGCSAGRLIQVCDRTGNVWTIGADCVHTTVGCAGVPVGCNGDSDDAGVIGGNLVAAGCSSATIEGVVGGMPRPPEAGVAVGVDCILYGCGVAGGCSSVGYEEVLGGLPRPPEVALVAGVDCKHALGCTVDEENLVGATTRPPEVRIRSGDALGEGTQPSKANTTRDAHPPLHSSVALASCESRIQNVLGPVGDGEHQDNDDLPELCGGSDAPLHYGEEACDEKLVYVEAVEGDKAGGTNDSIGGVRKGRGRMSKATKRKQARQDSEVKLKQMDDELSFLLEKERSLLQEKGARAKLQAEEAAVAAYRVDPGAAKIRLMEKSLRSKRIVAEERRAEVRRTDLAIMELQAKRLGQQAVVSELLGLESVA